MRCSLVFIVLASCLAVAAASQQARFVANAVRPVPKTMHVHQGLTLGADDKCQMPNNAYPPKPETAIPWTVINLDLSPQERWAHVVAPKAKEILGMIDGVVDLLPEDFRNKVIAAIDAKSESILDGFPAPYGDEIRGIAATTGIDVAKIILFNVAYELEGACTSIVAQDANGKIYHGRNLDFGLFLGVDQKNKSWALTERLRPLLYNGKIMKGGVNIYNVTGYAGFVGVLTGMKKNGFSITVDTRFDDNFDRGLFQWLHGNHTAHFLTFTTRDVMTNNATYDEAAAALQSIDMVGPSYIILGGAKAGEGVVITRSEGANLQPMLLSQALQNGSHFVLETNYDHWVNAPFYDDRRGPGKKCMEELGASGVGFPGLFNVLSGRPNLNMLTTYTALMNVEDGVLESYLQYCEWPCAPW